MHARRFAHAAAVVAFLAAAAIAVGDDPLDAIKDATVQLVIRTKGNSSPTYGVAFLIHKAGSLGYLVTHAQAIPPTDRIDSITARFAPLSGRARSESASVEFVGRDAEVAVLRVQRSGLPAPIQCASDPKSTANVTWVGVLQAQSSNSSNSDADPVVLSGSGNFIRNSTTPKTKDDKEPRVPKVFGRTNSRGSDGGGVFNKSGELLAVTAPGREIRLFAADVCGLDRAIIGTPAHLHISARPSDDGPLTVEVSAKMEDPLDSIRTAYVLILPKSDLRRPVAELSNGWYRAMPGAEKQLLRLDDRLAHAEFELPVADDARNLEYLVQVQINIRGGRTYWTKPESFTVRLGESHTNPPASKPATSANTAAEPPPPGELVEWRPAEIPDASDAETRLPGPVQRIDIAGDGRYLVLRMTDFPGLAVYDAFEARLSQVLQLGTTKFQFGAGGDTAFVHLTDDNTFETWQLSSGQRIARATPSIEGDVSDIVMGAARSDQALIITITEATPVPRIRLFRIDPLRLQSIETINDVMIDVRNRLNVWQTSRDMTWLACICRMRPTTQRLYRAAANEYSQVRSSKSALASYALADDGSVYFSHGDIFDSAGKLVGDLGDKVPCPAPRGPWVLAVDRDGGTWIVPAETAAPICAWQPLPAWTGVDDEEIIRTSGMNLQRRVVFLPHLRRVLFVPLSNDRIVQRPFDLRKAFEQSDAEYLVALSRPDVIIRAGQNWRYRPDIASRAGGTKLELMIAPNGMTISRDNELRWRVPDDWDGTRQRVVLLIRDAKGNERYQNFSLGDTDEPIEAPPAEEPKPASAHMHGQVFHITILPHTFTDR